MSALLHPDGAQEDVGFRLHGLPDDFVMAALYHQIRDLDPGAAHFVGIPFSNGKIVYHAYAPGNSMPSEHQVEFLRQLIINVNKNIDHGGCWIIGWYGKGFLFDPWRIESFWKDEDGDPHVIVTMDDPWHLMREKDMQHWLEDHEAAWRQVQINMIAEMELKPREMAKMAQGERLPRVTH